MARFLRTGVGSKVRGPVGMAVRVAVEARCTAAGFLGPAVLGLIVLLLRERCHQKAQTFNLLGRENAVEQLIIVFDRDELALRDVPEVSTLIEVHRRWKLRQEMFRDVVLDVETREVAVLLALDLIDQKVRKYETPFRMLRVGQRIEALGKEVLLANLFRSHGGETLPALSRRKLDSDSLLQRLAAVHRDAGS